MPVDRKITRERDDPDHRPTDKIHQRDPKVHSRIRVTIDLAQEPAIASEGHRRSLAEIARAAGFFDQAHLTRHFRRAFGQSPGQWRQQVLCKKDFNFPGFVQDAWLTSDQIEALANPLPPGHSL